MRNYKNQLGIFIILFIAISSISLISNLNYTDEQKDVQNYDTTLDPYNLNPKSSAIYPLSLNVKNESSYVYFNQPLNFSIDLDSGTYIIWADPGGLNDIDITIIVATDSDFTTIINTTNDYGINQDERCIVRILSTITIYIQINCPSSNDWCDILVSDNLNSGYTSLSINQQSIYESIDTGIYVTYYITVPAKKVKIEAQTISTDISVKASIDPIIKNIIGTSDSLGEGAIETIELTFETQQTIYIQVYGKSGSIPSFIFIKVSEISSSTTDDDDDEKDQDEDQNPLNNIDSNLFLLIIILSAVGITIPTIYIITSRKKKDENNKKSISSNKPVNKEINSLMERNFLKSRPIQRMLTQQNALEVISNTHDLHITIFPIDYLEKVDFFEWEDDDKLEFLKEMSALPPSKRDKIINEMIRKTFQGGKV